jgi:Arc/MetJ family transcription regulator
MGLKKTTVFINEELLAKTMEAIGAKSKRKAIEM